MKQYLLFLMIFSGIADSICAQQHLPATPPAGGGVQIETAQQVVTGMFAALAALNIDKMKFFCANDIIILESGKIWNFDSLATRINAIKNQSLDFNRINKLDFIDNKIAGDIAWLSYFNYAAIVAAGRTTHVKWLESVVLKKIKDQWKICLLHSTELERTP